MDGFSDEFLLTVRQLSSFSVPVDQEEENGTSIRYTPGSEAREKRPSCLDILRHDRGESTSGSSLAAPPR